MRLVIALGWLVTGGIIVRLVVGSEPGEQLAALSATLLAVWAGLIAAAVTVAGVLAVQAWRAGRRWQAELERSQMRLRMSGGLKLQGGSAGLAFCLNALGALQRANPDPVRRSWLWRRFFRALRSDAAGWAATGVVTASGRIEPVVLEPKIRACLQRADIRHVLTPRQREASQHFIDRVAGVVASATRERGVTQRISSGAQLGFASERTRLRGHQCRHVAQSVMAIGGLTSRWHIATNALATAVTIAMLIALPELRSILWPPTPPVVSAPTSPSPYHLWVSLDTRHPESFYVVLESDFWANRRSTVSAYSGADGSVRAEMRLNRLYRPGARDEEDGTVWVERRRRFLGREFMPGERVGRYSFSYVTRLSSD
jgi:hypothetical protein